MAEDARGTYRKGGASVALRLAPSAIILGIEVVATRASC